MAGSYVGTALKGTSMLAHSDFASRGQQQRRAIRLDDCSGASQLGGRLKPFHWEEGGLPADLETVVVFRGSWRGWREDGMESSTLGHFHASLQMRQKGSYATLLNLSKKLSLHKLSFCKQSHQFDDMARLGEEAKSSGTNRRRPWTQTLMGLETAVR